MSYKQHNSPFTNYSSPKRTKRSFEPLNLDLTPIETALGTTNTEDLTNTDEQVANNATKGATTNADEISEWEQNQEIYGKMTTKSGNLARKSNDESLPPRIRASAKRKLADQQSREKLQEERNFGDGGRNERHAEKLRLREEKKLEQIQDRNFRKSGGATTKADTIDGGINVAGKPRDRKWSETQKIDNKDLGDFEFTADQLKALNLGPSMKQKNNMKQINSRGSAFPMVNPDMEDPTIMPPNRAGGAVNTGILEQGASITDPGLKPQSQAAAAQMMGDISSSVGQENQSLNPMAPGQDNTQDQIAQAQENLGTDAATNTPPNTMGSAGMGMHGPAKKDWIQDVNKDIEKRGTKGVCTGSKFGSDSCPPGSKRYNLAKTFKKMNK